MGRVAEGDEPRTYAATMSRRAIASAHLYRHAILSLIAFRISSSTSSLRNRPASTRERLSK